MFVKSIAVIYNGYAVAATLWEVELAFCTIHTITFRHGLSRNYFSKISIFATMLRHYFSKDT